MFVQISTTNGVRQVGHPQDVFDSHWFNRSDPPILTSFVVDSD